MSKIKHILVVVGTRPNFVKVTQFRRVAAKMGGFDLRIVHTGQHYDSRMADVFFEQFGLVPDYLLAIPAASACTQTAEVMQRLEALVTKDFTPDLVVVPGDVNSTLAAALAAHKIGIPVAHLEAGLRSFDRSMPEEINRLLVDELSDLLFVTEESGLHNLTREAKAGKAFFVGNTMIDTMVAYDGQIQASSVLRDLGVADKPFALMTMHRPATVDSPDGLRELFALIRAVLARHPIVFPIHPRTRKRVHEFGLDAELSALAGLILTEPLGYFDFQKLIAACRMVLTDSGGIQEETTFRGVPCLTLRPNTERPSTVEIGTNELVPFDVARVGERLAAIADGTFKRGSVPRLWDGKATERVLEVLAGL